MKLLTSYNSIMLATLVLYLLLVGHVFAQEESAASQPSETDTAVEGDAIDHVTVSEVLPGWIKRGNYRDVDGTDYVVVIAGPDIDLGTVRNRMKENLVAATDQYIDEKLEVGAAKLFGFNATEISNRFLVKDREHLARVEVSVGTMLSQHQQLGFSQSFREELVDRWKQRKSSYRLWQIGLISAGLLFSLLIVFCCFRINQATRGFYAGRLQFAAVAAILALIISGVYAGRFL